MDDKDHLYDVAAALWESEKDRVELLPAHKAQLMIERHWQTYHDILQPTRYRVNALYTPQAVPGIPDFPTIWAKSLILLGLHGIELSE